MPEAMNARIKRLPVARYAKGKKAPPKKGLAMQFLHARH
jgi:hypothetical protein